MRDFLRNHRRCRLNASPNPRQTGCGGSHLTRAGACVSGSLPLHCFRSVSFLLTQYLWNISGRMKNSNDLKGLPLRVVHDPIISIRLHQPEEQRQIRQVFANAAGKRGLRQKCAAFINRGLNSIRRIHAVACDISPDFEEVFGGLGCELITAHAWRFSASQARFLSSIFERTWSESINSPRCAAA